MRMTKKQLRIAVAKDVLKSIRTTTMVVERGKFLDGGEKGLKAVTGETDSRMAAEAVKPFCQVCALGACFLSLVKLDNLFDFAVLDRGSGELRVADSTPYPLFLRLRKVFSGVQMLLIEQAFEQGKGFCEDAACESVYMTGTETRFLLDITLKQAEKIWQDGGLRDQAVAFGNRRSSSPKRLVAIMRNIVRNDGTFRP